MVVHRHRLATLVAVIAFVIVGGGVLASSAGATYAPSDVIALGGVSSTNGQGAYLYRIDSQGQLLWERALPSGTYWGNWITADRDLREDAFYMMNCVQPSGSVHDLLKFDADGNLLWSVPISPTAWSVSVNPVEGGVYVGSASGIYRVDGDGNVLWGPLAFGVSPTTEAYAVADARQGGLATFDFASVVVRFDAQGNVLWTRALSHPVHPRAIPHNGGWYVGADAYVANTHRLDASGDLLWTKNCFPSCYTYPRAVSPLDGSLFVTGGWPSLTGRTLPDGTVLWTVSNSDEACHNWGGLALAADIAEPYFYTGDTYCDRGVGKRRSSDASLVWRLDPGHDNDNFWVWSGAPPENHVYAEGPGTCISSAHPCVAVPVRISHTTAENVRGFTVSLQLSGELALCGAGIAEGTYLSAVGGTIYQVVDNGGGSYTVDGAILGLPCGATAASGTLFTVNVGSAAAGGMGTVTITAVVLRDCNNDPVAAVAEGPVSIVIDNSAPTAIAALVASQVRFFNDTDGTTKITVSWPAVEAGATVHVYRAGFGFYPEYDDLGGVMPAYPAIGTWVPAGDVTSGTTLVDEPTTRDFWYYVATVEDACGNVSPVSNMTAGTLNYHLGDVMPDTVTYAGDNAVGISDISLLGGHYAVTEGHALYRACLDVGPTTTHHVDGRPLTDNKINFEDMMMFAINYGPASASLTTLPVAAVASDAVWVEGPAKVTAGQTFTVSLRLSGSGALLGLSAALDWDRSIAELVSIEAGELITAQGGVALGGGGGLVDCALLGADRRLAGEGELARVTFRALASGSPRVAVGAVDARDAANRTVELTGTPPTVVPAVTSFAPAMPNPFRGTTTLSYALAKGGAVELAVYGVDGRKVAVLASGVQEAGSYRLTWDGGNARPGLYYARLTTPQGKFTRTLVLVK